jgi:hypothetical protein
MPAHPHALLPSKLSLRPRCAAPAPPASGRILPARAATARAARPRAARAASTTGAGGTQQPDRQVAVVLKPGLVGAAQGRDIGHGGQHQHAVAAEQFAQVLAERGAKHAGGTDLLVADIARPGEALGHARAQRRRIALDQRAVGEPGLARLQVTEIPVHRVKRFERQRHLLGSTQHALDPPGRALQRLGRRRQRQRTRTGSGAASAPSSTSATRAKVPMSRANQPQVSKLGARSSAPSKLMRPCVGRIPNRPQ